MEVNAVKIDKIAESCKGEVENSTFQINKGSMYSPYYTLLIHFVY